MHTPRRRAFVTRLAFHFLWMGIACTWAPALALCNALYIYGSYYLFLEALHDYRLLWMHLAGIGLLAAGIAILGLVRCRCHAVPSFSISMIPL